VVATAYGTILLLSRKSSKVPARIDTLVEWEYIRHGGILPMVLRRLAAE